MKANADNLTKPRWFRALTTLGQALRRPRCASPVEEAASEPKPSTRARRHSQLSIVRTDPFTRELVDSIKNLLPALLCALLAYMAPLTTEAGDFGNQLVLAAETGSGTGGQEFREARGELIVEVHGLPRISTNLLLPSLKKGDEGPRPILAFAGLGEQVANQNADQPASHPDQYLLKNWVHDCWIIKESKLGYKAPRVDSKPVDGFRKAFDALHQAVGEAYVRRLEECPAVGATDWITLPSDWRLRGVSRRRV